MNEIKKIINPGYFSKDVLTDRKRGEYNAKNETIINHNVKIDYLFMGDSITEQFELPIYFAGSDKVFINRAISGDVTEYTLKRFDADVIQLKPKNCVLMIGINDSMALEDNPWINTKGESIENVLNNSFNNIAAMYEKCSVSNINLIIFSVTPTNMSYTNKNEERNIYIFELNKRLKEFCKSKNIIYVDCYKQMVKENDIYVKDGITAEGIHPNVLGNDIIMSVLKYALKENNLEF